jgi:hypothetical protein
MPSFSRQSRLSHYLPQGAPVTRIASLMPNVRILLDPPVLQDLQALQGLKGPQVRQANQAMC